MKQIIVEISDIEEKALLWDIVSIQDWLNNFVHNKARKVADRIIIDHTDKNPQKISQQDKEQIIEPLELKTAAERQAEFEEQVRG